MLTKRPTQHDNIVEEDHAFRPLKACQHEIHQTLKGFTGITQPKLHDTELKQTLSGAESSLWSVQLGNLHLPVPTQEVKRTEPLRPVECVKGGVNPGQRVCVFLCYVVQVR